MSFYLIMIQIIWYSHAFFKFRVFINTLLLVWPFLYFVLYSWPKKIWKVLMCFGACPDWFTISFFKKTHFFSLNFHCFYKQFTKITALFYLTLFTIIHLYFKSIQIKFAGEFLLTSFNGFFNIFWVQDADSLLQFLHFCTKWNNAYHNFDFKKSH